VKAKCDFGRNMLLRMQQRRGIRGFGAIPQIQILAPALSDAPSVGRAGWKRHALEGSLRGALSVAVILPAHINLVSGLGPRLVPRRKMELDKPFIHYLSV
jgi:hypothetical protein